MEKSEIKFLREKPYKWKADLGQGGCGKTVLIEDEIIDEQFACKKFVPLQEKLRHELYSNFIREIKILHQISHRNIVRIFNYYLYPSHHTGYVLMEFIDGNSIDLYLKNNPDRINIIFSQVISAFVELEKNEILHRDIRPQNILVTNSGNVKVIDFGFGKKIEFPSDAEKSISLNWYYDIPDEFSDSLYDRKTDIYFIGKLFEEIISKNDIGEFSYSIALKKMILPNPEKRIDSFFEVERLITNQISQDIEFTAEDKLIYQNFAVIFDYLLISLQPDCEYIRDIPEIEKNLTKIYQDNILNDYIQNPVSVSQAFLRGSYRYNRKTNISIEDVNKFLKLLKSCSQDRKVIVINNIWTRFDSYTRTKPELDDLPF
jgi:serine/threonine protein kinase